MVGVGYTLMCEQTGPKELVEYAVRAEAALPGPDSFASATQFVREEDVAQVVPCGPDVEGHVAAFRRFVDAGFTHVALVQVGGESQETFLDWAGEHLLPRLREL